MFIRPQFLHLQCQRHLLPLLDYCNSVQEASSCCLLFAGNPKSFWIWCQPTLKVARGTLVRRQALRGFQLKKLRFTHFWPWFLQVQFSLQKLMQLSSRHPCLICELEEVQLLMTSKNTCLTHLITGAKHRIVQFAIVVENISLF